MDITQITLLNYPNQEIYWQGYTLRFISTKGCMSIDIAYQDEILVQGHRLVNGQFLIPYVHLERDGINFLFDIPDGAMPNYREFGITQFLYAFKTEDLIEYLGGQDTIADPY